MHDTIHYTPEVRRVSEGPSFGVFCSALPSDVAARRLNAGHEGPQFRKWHPTRYTSIRCPDLPDTHQHHLMEMR